MRNRLSGTSVPHAFRRAAGADAAAIARLHIGSWRAAYRGLLPAAFLRSLDLGARTAAWKDRLLAPGVIVLLDEDDGYLRGFCASAPAALAGPPAWEIASLHVEPSLRGRGIGGALFEAATGLARAHGAHDLVLWVVDGNTPARRFYAQRGMEPDGARQSREVGPGAVLQEVRYRLALAGR